MKLNSKGFAEVTLLLYVIGAMALFFVPNPVSSSLGVGIRPNKTVQTEKVELIKDKDGTPIAYKTTTSDKDMQQKVGFFEWLRSLPFLVILFMGLGIVFPPVALFLQKLRLKAASAYSDLTGETKRIVFSVKAGLNTITDQTQKDKFLNAMSMQQDSTTKNLVKELLKQQ